MRCGALYTSKELSEIFDIHICTVWDWRKRGRIPNGTKVSHKMRIWTQREMHQMFPEIFDAPDNGEETGGRTQHDKRDYCFGDSNYDFTGTYESAGRKTRKVRQSSSGARASKVSAR